MADSPSQRLTASPSQPPARQTLPRRMRLAHAREFDAVRRGGVRREERPLAVSGRPNGLPHWRLGLSVGRAVGGAVVRNRAKRHVREAFRLSQRELPMGAAGGYDIVVAVRGHEELPLAEYRRILVGLAEGVHREWERRGSKMANSK